MIKLEHVSKEYQKGVPALNDVNLHIEPGEFVFVIGNSGSGKSTLIKLLLKELEPTKGRILINGKSIAGLNKKQIPKFRRNIGVVFQDFRLLQDRNIYENIGNSEKIVLFPIGNMLEIHINKIYGNSIFLYFQLLEIVKLVFPIWK